MAVNSTDVGNNPRAPAPTAYKPPVRLGGFLSPGTVIPANDTNLVVIRVQGAGRIRVAAKVSAAGTLRLRWRAADHVTNISIPAANPADPGTALVAATELIIDVASNPGHAYLEVAVVNGAAPSTVDHVDVFQTAEGN